MILRRHIASRRFLAFTMMEFMVAMGISGILLTAVAALALYSGRSMAAMVNYVDLNRSSRNALDVMTRDIRQASHIKDHLIDTNQALVVFEYEDEAGDYTISYAWYGTNYMADTNYQGLLIRQDSRDPIVTSAEARDKALLTDCERFVPQFYLRRPKADYQLTETTDREMCKLVQVQWTCSRYVLGMARKTESVQTAKVGMRKQTKKGIE